VTLTFQPLSMQELITTAGLPPELLDSDLSNLIELCGFFVTVREGIIYFVHQSAKDYLVAGGAQRLLPPGLRKEHRVVVDRSLDTMSKSLKKDMAKLRHPGAPARSASIDARLRAIGYACSFGSPISCNTSAITLLTAEAIKSIAQIKVAFTNFFLASPSLVRGPLPFWQG
jgi:hypothetical protein